MHFLQRARWGMSLAAILTVAGCLPNRAALSPDGRQLYFATNDDAGFEIKDSSHLYALDIETGRLRALTDASGRIRVLRLDPLCYIMGEYGSVSRKLGHHGFTRIARKE